MEQFRKYYELPVKCYYGMFHDANGNHILDIACGFPYDKPLTDLLLQKINDGHSDIIFTKSVYYKPTTIFTTDNDVLLNIRGWGRFKYYPNGEEIQDAIGNEIAALINDARS